MCGFCGGNSGACQTTLNIKKGKNGPRNVCAHFCVRAADKRIKKPDNLRNALHKCTLNPCRALGGKTFRCVWTANLKKHYEIFHPSQKMSDELSTAYDTFMKIDFENQIGEDEMRFRKRGT